MKNHKVYGCAVCPSLKSAFLWALFCFFPFYASADPCEKSAVENFGLSIIEQAIAEEYEAAFSLIESLRVSCPDKPAPYFLKAAVLHSMMLDFESNLWEKEFESSLQKTLQICDTLLLINAFDSEALFYRGGALSYYGLHFSRAGKYLQGISFAVRAVHTLQKALEIDSSWTDAYLAIGSYKYWRSYLTRNFSWLPFFPDQREEGIQDIKKAYCKAGFSKWPALSNLGWIYMQEKRYDLAEKCADEGLSAFPNSRFFLWLKAEAAAKQNRFKEAAKAYQLLLDSLTSEKYNNHFNEIVLHLKLAQCSAAEQDAQKARIHARKAAELNPDADAPLRVVEKQKEARRLLHALEKQRF